MKLVFLTEKKRMLYTPVVRSLSRALFTLGLLISLPITVHGNQLSVGEGKLIRIQQGQAATVFVADPEVVDVQVPAPNAILVVGRKTGSTTLYALDDAGASLLQQRIDVKHNTEALQEVLRKRFPNVRIALESAHGSIQLTGSVPDAQTADAIVRTVQPYIGEKDHLINQLGIASPTQVHLRVRVTEVSRAVTQKLGVNWSAITNPSNFTAGLISGRPFQTLISGYSEDAASVISNSLINGVAEALRSNSSSNNGFFSRSAAYTGSSDGGYSFLGGYSHKGNSIQAMIDVLDKEGLISVLAEPNLTAVSGQTASFLAGGEFPIPVQQEENTVTIEFKPFGVALDFTPTVMADDRISIKVRPEISELDPNSSIVMNGMVIPGLSVRRVETTVEMASGQSFAIGGLLQNNVRDILSQVPGLGALPVLGKLFSSSEYQNNKSELVVIVTPYLVKPTDPSRLSTPLDSMRPASDIEFILHRKIGLDPLEGTAPRLTGQAGFVY